MKANTMRAAPDILRKTENSYFLNSRPDPNCLWTCRDPDCAASAAKQAGNAIDFLVEVQGMDFSEAVRLLLAYQIPAPA